MASQQQAARLASRMQRELTMLSSDPPPGACAWPVDDHTLTHLHAQIQGPEGTVYAGGTFKLDIEVPERYPFEPPCITFLTPVYHPNVDSGGRICLDILNLPPKGAWRPSLNLSTLLASIGLLLAEPNPDDGLMVDITAEYKHDRTKFDAKAKQWTRLYAIQDGLKPTGTRNDVQLAEPATFLGRKHDKLEAVVTKDQLKDVPDCNIDHTLCSRKKLSLHKDLNDQISLATSKNKHSLHKRKTSLQADSEGPISSAPCLRNNAEFHAREKMTGMEKENKPPTNSYGMRSIVGSVNPVDTSTESKVSNKLQLVEEILPTISGTHAPSRFKSLKLKTRADIFSTNISSASGVLDNGIGSAAPSVEMHPIEVSNDDVKNHPGIYSEVATVIVSDSDSDEELSESFSFSITQRCLNNKRKVRSKVG